MPRQRIAFDFLCLQLRQQEYKIVRTFKEVVALYDKMKQTCSSGNA